MTGTRRPGINPGIRNVVEWLQGLGFETVDSGDGETHDFECDRPEPYVVIQTLPHRLVDDARRLRACLQARGIELEPQGPTPGVPVAQANYCPVSGTAFIDLTGVRW